VDGLVADREPAGGGPAAPAALEWQARGASILGAGMVWGMLRTADWTY